MKHILNLMKKYQEIIAYLFWGVLTTVVSWGTYSLFVVILENETYKITIANILSWICAVLFAYVTNKIWVFHSHSWKVKICLIEFWKFISTRFITGVFEIMAVPILVGIGLNQTIFGIEGMVAKIFVSVIVVILNYIFSKLFIFKKEGKTV